MKLYNIYYKGGLILGQPDDKYEGTTDNFDLWLEKHNKNRKEDGQSHEYSDEFRIEEIYVESFSKNKVKIYFSAEDLEDMMCSFHKEFKGDNPNILWNTWSSIDENDNTVEVELHLGQENDI